MTTTLPDVRREVLRLAALIDAPSDDLPTYGHSRDMAYPHIEVDGQHLAWVVVERGVEQERRITQDLNELLYWIFEGVTWSMASAWELRHRVEDQDCRLLIWTKQLELLATLDASWPALVRAKWGPQMRDAGLE